MIVPAPGHDTSSQSPPAISTRSRITARPKWSFAFGPLLGSNPTPSSVTSSTTDPFRVCSDNEAFWARACLPTFVSASCARRYRIVSWEESRRASMSATTAHSISVRRRKSLT